MPVGLPPPAGVAPLVGGGVGIDSGQRDVEGVSARQRPLHEDGGRPQSLRRQSLALEGARSSGNQEGGVGVGAGDRGGALAGEAPVRGLEVAGDARPFLLGGGRAAQERIVGGGEGELEQGVAAVAVSAAGISAPREVAPVRPGGRIVPERRLRRQEAVLLPRRRGRHVDDAGGEDGGRGAEGQGRREEEEDEARRRRRSWGKGKGRPRRRPRRCRRHGRGGHGGWRWVVLWEGIVDVACHGSRSRGSSQPTVDTPTYQSEGCLCIIILCIIIYIHTHILARINITSTRKLYTAGGHSLPHDKRNPDLVALYSRSTLIGRKFTTLFCT